MFEATPTRKSLLHGLEVGMLCTVDVDGMLQSRPIYTREVDPNGTLWFYASRSSQQVTDGETGPLVNVVYGHPSLQRYVSVCGRVSIVDDEALRRVLWSDGARSTFKDGPDDQDLVLLRVDVTHVDYWEGPSNVLTRLIGFNAAPLPGELGFRRASGAEDPFAPEL